MVNATRKRRVDGETLSPNPTLYVRNLNDQISFDVLRHGLYIICSTYGDILEIHMKRGDKQMRGQAHVVFNNDKSASLALDSLQQFNFFNKPMILSFSNKKSKIVSQAEATVEED